MGTPLTHEHYLRRHRGTYGAAYRADRGESFPGPGTPLPGLFTCGDSNLAGIGVPAVATSGWIAANTVATVGEHHRLIKEVVRSDTAQWGRRRRVAMCSSTAPVVPGSRRLRLGRAGCRQPRQPLQRGVHMTGLLLDSLQRRMRAMHSLYYQAVDTMGVDHVNHFERDGVLPIAFSLFHYTNMEDVCFLLITGASPVWNDDWQARVRMAVNDHGKHRTVDEMGYQRIGDFEAFKEYQRAVFDRTEAWLGTLDAAEITRVVVPRPFPEQVASTYSARVAGPEGITVLDAAECWLYQHGLRHMGEIEHARGLVGLGGMTS